MIGNPTIDPILNLPFDSPWVMVLRLACAMLAAAAVGLERATSNQPAGLRTHMVLALGACGVMILSLVLPIRFAGFSSSGDPGRMAAQVISGIGFLGGGAILKFGFNIRGLTTAASIWTMSAIGLVFGAGLYILGVAMTVLLFFTLHGVDRIEDRFLVRRNMRIISVVFDSQALIIKSITRSIRDTVDVKRISIEETVSTGETEITIHCRIAEDRSIRKIFDTIKSQGEVKRIKIE